MKTVKEWYELLPEAVRDLAIKACEDQEWSTEEEMHTLTEAVDLFTWSDTNLGRDFWLNIYRLCIDADAGVIGEDEFHSACLAALAEIATPAEEDPEMKSDPEWAEKTKQSMNGWVDSKREEISTAHNPTESALDTQEGGSHYRDCKIQPVEFIHANKLGFCEGAIVKYVVRHGRKNGVEDLKKARHFIDMLIELEYGDKA